MDDTHSLRSARELVSLRRRLLHWYGKRARDLPWRHTHDPYKIWVSEIMLQQTQVETVLDYYRRFLQLFPNIESLATAEESAVMRSWEGLGYYRRARHLHLAAQQIVANHGGQFPREMHALRALPGIGRYTAGAILSFAFDQRQPILEANTIRLFSRLLAMRGDTRSSANQQLLWQFAEQLLPKRGGGSGKLNQSLMEIGSLICQPRNPYCDRCPLADHCLAFQQGIVDVIPELGKKMQYEARTEAAVVIRSRDRVLLRKCQANERWAGLWDFPRFHLKSRNSKQRLSELEQLSSAMTQRKVAVGQKLMTLQHGVTKYRITLSCYEGQFSEPKGRLPPPLRWVKTNELDDYPLSVTGRKISAIVLGPA